MAGKRTYEFNILAKISDAVSAIQSLAEQSNKKLGSINMNTAISAIRDGFEIIKGVAEAAFAAISGFMKSAVGEANEAEEANIRLANSLRLMGDLSTGAVERFNQLAKSIASVSTFTADAVKSSVAVAKQFRLTNAEAEKTIRVAADLAAAMGITLEEATRKVSQTFNGFVDRDLAKTIPGLKSLGIQALVSGQAVGLIGERVAGTAAALGNTFSGALFRAQEALNDILETFGNIIIKNPALIVGLNQVAAGFRELNNELGKSEQSMKDLVTDGFLLIIQAAVPFLEAMQRILNNISFVTLIFNKFTAVLGAAAAAVSSFLSGDGAGSGESILEALKEDLAALDEQFGKTLNSRDDFFGPLIAKTNEIVASTTTAVNQARKLGDVTTAAGNQAEDSLSGVNARMRELGDQFKAQIESLSKDPITVGFDLFITKRLEASTNDKIAIGAGITNAILKGAEGARTAVSAALGAAANAIIPGIGPVVQQIVDVLGQGPEKVREMVRGFARAIPEIIKNIAEAFPVLIEELARELPPALAKTMPTVAVGFATALIKNIPAIIKGFVEGLIQAAKDFVQAIFDAITGVAGDVGNGLTGSGESDSIFAGVPILQGVGDFFGFADGGRTPRNPRLNGDKGLARIGPNEQVFNSDLTDRLEGYLNDNQGGKPTTIIAQLVMDRKVLAEKIYQINKAGFRTA